MADEAHDEQERERGGWSLFRFVWVFGVIILIYVLSIGPVLKLDQVTRLNSRVVSVMYEPLFVASRHVPALGRFLDWYVFKVCGVLLLD